MESSLELPLFSASDTIANAYSSMLHAETSAILVADVSSFRLVESETLWAALKNDRTTLAHVYGEFAVHPIETENFSLLSAGMSMAIQTPAAGAKTAMLFAGASYINRFSLAPAVHYCLGPRRHSLPPARLAPDATCSLCGHPVK
jgi:hypothetical protein